MTTNRETALVEDEIVYTAVVRNDGPDASSVSFQDDLPDEVSLVSVATSQGFCKTADPLVCSLGTLSAGAQATLTITTRAARLGWPGNAGHVFTESTEDPYTFNNTSYRAWTRIMEAGPQTLEVPCEAKLGARSQLWSPFRCRGSAYVARETSATLSLLPGPNFTGKVNASLYHRVDEHFTAQVARVSTLFVAGVAIEGPSQITVELAPDEYILEVYPQTARTDVPERRECVPVVKMCVGEHDDQYEYTPVAHGKYSARLQIHG